MPVPYQDYPKALTARFYPFYPYSTKGFLDFLRFFWHISRRYRLISYTPAPGRLRFPTSGEVSPDQHEKHYADGRCISAPCFFSPRQGARELLIGSGCPKCFCVTFDKSNKTYCRFRRSSAPIRSGQIAKWTKKKRKQLFTTSLRRPFFGQPTNIYRLYSLIFRFL